MILNSRNIATIGLLIALLALLPTTASATTVTRVDRAIHEGFELLIIHCDSLPEFSLEYDRVAGVAELRVQRGKISKRASQTLLKMGNGLTIRGATVDLAKGLIRFRTPKPVVIREYLISGPSALILDFGVSEDVAAPLPFELDREGYLKKGGIAEKGGRLEMALGYVDHVRGWEGSDLSLTHRAGVIEQRLGRWDQALETLAESAQIAEFAADAHARRTMIFLAKGDTASMGEEWAGYFHAEKKKPKIEPVELPVDSVRVAQIETTKPTTPATEQKKGLKLPKILSAGGGDSLDYLYYGWGFLAVGFLSLIGLLLSARKNALPKNSYPEVDISVPFSQHIRDRVEQPAHNQSTVAEAPATTYSPKPVINLPDESYRSTSGTSRPIFQQYEAQAKPANDSTIWATPPKPRSAQSHRDRVPVDDIVALAEKGVSESEIANQLLVGRDEVAMVLNLVRLARRTNS